MLFSEMKRIFKCDNINISERLNTVEASFDIEFPLWRNFGILFQLCPHVIL